MASQGESSSSSGTKKVTVTGSLGHKYEISKASDFVLAYVNSQGDDGDEEAKRKFEAEFVRGKPETDLILDVLHRAVDLDLKGLISIACQKMADRMNNKSVEWLRKAFGIENDVTAAEDAEMKAQYAWAFEGVDPDDGYLAD